MKHCIFLNYISIFVSRLTTDAFFDKKQHDFLQPANKFNFFFHNNVFKFSQSHQFQVKMYAMMPFV